ncbi:hypothetical protein J2Y86_001402 [Pseudomonas migulae]|jgi:hypothetical protein|uniref:hypothetical protein n=1 Tax=Pseudomonas migulae TaxID=78543 RepID=UPI00209EDE40|nr:hypothetical protein [Pseudomonas migulae]MCP1496695.1 hypothetical protein [Pseudomonas migulae]
MRRPQTSEAEALAKILKRLIARDRRHFPVFVRPIRHQSSAFEQTIQTFIGPLISTAVVKFSG